MKIKLNKFKKDKGFTLIELILVLGIGSLAFMGFIQMEQKRQEMLSAENVGGQLNEVGQAVAQYINLNNSALQAAIPSGTDVPLALTGLTQNGGPPTIGSAPNRLLLPATYSNRLAFPTVTPVTFEIRIKNNAGVITGLVISNSSIQDKSGAIRYDWTGTAIKKAGSNAGVIFGLANQMSGLNGNWSLNNTDFTSINGLGKVGYRVAYQGTYDSTYLRLDGMYPMNGNLNMGNYNIKNATDVSYTGWLYGNNAVMNNLLTGTITNAGNITTQSINGKTTVLTSANAATYSNNVGPTRSYANFDNFYANCINCGFPTDTGSANLSTTFKQTNGDVRIGADGKTGTLFVKDVILGGNGGYVTNSKNAFLSDRLPRYADRGMAIVTNGSFLPMPQVLDATFFPNASGYVCRWTGEGSQPVPKIEIVPAMQWVQGSVNGPISISHAGSGIVSNQLVLNTTLTQNQYTISSFQAYATVSGSSWAIHVETPNYGGPNGGTALAHVYCDYGT